MLEGSNYTYQEDYTINYAIKPKPVASLTLSQTQFTYNGSEQVPQVKDGDNIVAGDGNIIIDKPQSINAGNYSITITGQNNYVGKTVLNYVISPAQLNVTIGEQKTFTYNKTVQKPTYTINNTNISASDYSIISEESINVGSYKITISSNSDNYVGKYIIEYVIKPYQAQIVEKMESQTLQLKVLTEKF